MVVLSSPCEVLPCHSSSPPHHLHVQTQRTSNPNINDSQWHHVLQPVTIAPGDIVSCSSSIATSPANNIVCIFYILSHVTKHNYQFTAPPFPLLSSLLPSLTLFFSIMLGYVFLGPHTAIPIAAFALHILLYSILARLEYSRKVFSRVRGVMRRDERKRKRRRRDKERRLIYCHHHSSWEGSESMCLSSMCS